MRNKKNIIKVIIIIIITKLIWLFFWFHLFDYRTLINTLERNILYGWWLFEFWNKWNLILLSIKPFYLLYQWFIVNYNDWSPLPLLLYFCTKIPYFLLDIASWLILYKIISWLIDERYWLLSCVVWLLMPNIYLLYWIHWHYDIFLLFWVLLILYWTLKDSFLSVMGGLVIAITTKYFPVIYVPIIILFLVYKWYGLKKLSYIAWWVCVWLLLSYAHLFNDSQLVSQMYWSIINQSSDAVIGSSTVQPLNIVSSFYFLLSSQVLTSADRLYRLVSLGVKINICLVLIYMVYTFLRVVRWWAYDYISLVKDLFMLTIMMFVCSANFQIHYFAYFIPFSIIIGFYYKDNRLTRMMGILYMMIFMYHYGHAYWVGEYFYNSPFIRPFVTISTDQYMKYTAWSLIMVMLLLVMYQIVRLTDNNNKIDKSTIVWMVFLWSASWLVMVLWCAQWAYRYFNSNPRINDILFQRYPRYRGIIYWEYSSNILGSQYVFAEREKIWALTNEQIVSNLNVKLDYFKAYIIWLPERINSFYINECLIDPKIALTENIYNFYDGSSEQWFEVPLNCLRTSNVVSWISFTWFKVKLYMRNFPFVAK